MLFTTFFICALVCLLVVSINGDGNQLTTSETSANGQSTNNSEESSSQEQTDQALDNELNQCSIIDVFSTKGAERCYCGWRNGYGTANNQLASPQGLCVDDDGNVIVTDYLNNRVVEWKNGATSGQVVAGRNDEGNGNNQLYYPTDVIIDKKSDSLIICDSGNTRIMRWPRRGGTSGEPIISNLASCFGLAMDDQEYLYISSPTENVVRRWRIGESHGIVVAGGDEKGDRLDQLNWPTYIAVDGDHSVYVTDNYNHHVMKWVKGAKEGIVVAGGSGDGNALTQLALPGGIAIDQSETVYVVDYHNHRIMCWPKGATEGSIVAGGNGMGERATQVKFSMCLAFDRQGKLYVTDKSNNRVQRFNI